MLHVSADEAMAACHTRQFADRVGGRDYASLDDLIAHARDTWWRRVTVPGWLEAFAAHPQIGDAAAIKAKFAAGQGAAQQRFGALSTGEQAAALATGGDAVFAELAALNATYRERFGHIFIICASGRPAAEILAELRRRIEASPLEELRAAAEQQMAITELRLRGLFKQQEGAAGAAGAGAAGAGAAAAAAPAASAAAGRLEQIGRHLAAAAGGGGRSPITTHVLDTALGLPARDMAVELHVLSPAGAGGAAAAAASAAEADDPRGSWVRLAAARTDADGRVGNLLPAGSSLDAGATYRVRFSTGPYLEGLARRFFPAGGAPAALPFAHSADRPPFYPRADVEFTVPRDPEARRAHYHIPLLLSPYGFSTYRGS